MPRFRAARACALAALAAAVATACGSDEPRTAASPAPTASTSAAPATTGGAGPSSSTTTTEAVRVIDVAFAGGQVAGGARRETVPLGGKVRIRVTSDVADEVHVHTYDARARVAPGQPAELEVDATIPGRHEVELEDRRRQLLVLEVR